MTVPQTVATSIILRPPLQPCLGKPRNTYIAVSWCTVPDPMSLANRNPLIYTALSTPPHAESRRPPLTSRYTVKKVQHPKGAKAQLAPV